MYQNEGLCSREGGLGVKTGNGLNVEERGPGDVELELADREDSQGCKYVVREER